ncbi:glycosyltransferase [Peribacillus frigoritolerans]|uniref:glycosyltransferase n=1 Tax=Peribacillus frigoritolerans TaxID=450367 RepID=UPI002282735B|nr:glycosyltransferase [Peribacillus frigoritolerans]MCY8935457.1 glycosyltransferase [Peribacillus frigoritolerans]
MKATMFFLIGSLDVQRGGLTKASLAQANTFAEMGYDTHILTFNFDTRYERIRSKLIELGQLNENVKVLNLYEELCGSEEDLSITQVTPETGYLDPHVGHNAFRVYENGLYTKYKKFHEDDSLDFIDYFNEQRYRVKKEVYDEYGLIRKVSYMDFASNKPRQMVFYNSNSQAYLSKWVNPENGKAIRVNWFEENGNIKAIYSNDEQLKLDWVERVIKDVENPVLVADARKTDLLMINVKNSSAAKIWRLHSSHLTAPWEADSDIASTVQTGIDHLDTLDAALVLTEQQKTDIENRFGKRTNLHVIPHAMKTNLKTGWFARQGLVKEERLAVVISRYSAIKNLDHIIKAFEIVVKKVPDAKLEFWGEGTEKDKLQKIINKANLTNHIKLNGYTQEPSEIYQSALFSILASKTEGFSLSVLESMSNATAVVSYDIRYGPNELIDNGENGVLVQKNNIDKLAEAMISMFNHPKTTIKMGKAALKKVERKFNQEIYANSWEHVVRVAIENRQLKNKSSKATSTKFFTE